MNTNKAETGRPQKYKKKYAASLIEFVVSNWEKGASFRSWCIQNKIPVSTAHGWVSNHAEFSDARLLCLEYEEQYWVNLLMKAAAGNGNPTEETMVKVKLKKDKDGKIIQTPDSQIVTKKQARMSVAAIQFALQNLFPDKWKNRQDIDIGNKEDEIDKMSPEQIAEARAKYQARLEILRKKHDKKP